MSDEAPVALITGTSRGLGYTTARKLLATGYRVVGVSRTSTDIDDAAFTAMQADISEEAACAQAVSAAIHAHGRVDVLVNNAAAMIYRNCWEYEPGELARQLRVNLTAPFLLSRAMIRHWLPAQATGSIVNVCSVESEVGWLDPPQAAYTVSKGGLVGLTRSLANDLALNGIRVNGVAPGVIRTDMTPPSGESRATDIPIGRLAEPAEIAEVIAFVAGPLASYMTGEIVYVDGGYRLP